MALRARDIMERAQRLVLDETSVRWPLAELCMWVNDAQREVVLQKPSALSANVVISLAADTMQELPNTYLALLRVVRNVTVAGSPPVRTGGRAVRIVSREVMDSQSPDWHDPTKTTPAKVVKHYLFDEQDPLHFYVYPPNDGTGKVEAIVSAAPAVIAATGDANALASYETVLALPDIYANAILDFVLYRSYAKDANFAGNAQRAALHYQQFANSLGMKVQIDAALSPNTSAQTKAS